MDVDNIYQSLPSESRVWIYQSNRKFTPEETEKIKKSVMQFAQQWVSHNQALKAYGDVYHDQFLVLMIDESQAGASGCSIDGSVHFVRQLQAHYGLDFFDRMTFAWSTPEGVQTAHKTEFSSLYQESKINDTTLVFDNLVKTKGEFEERWLRPLGESWHARMV